MGYENEMDKEGVWGRRMGGGFKMGFGIVLEVWKGLKLNGKGRIR